MIRVESFAVVPSADASEKDIVNHKAKHSLVGSLNIYRFFHRVCTCRCLLLNVKSLQ